MRPPPRALVVRFLFLTAWFLLGVAAPSVNAALPPCTDSADVSAAGIHVVQAAHRSSLWQETNGVAGLQQANCHGGSIVHDADRLVAEVLPRDLGVLGLCSFLVVQQCV